MAELAEDKGNDLPDTVGVSQDEIDHYYPLWLLWRATEKRFLPSQLLQEPSEPLAVLLEMDAYFDRIARQAAEAEKPNAEPEQ